MLEVNKKVCGSKIKVGSRKKVCGNGKKKLKVKKKFVEVKKVGSKKKSLWK